MAVSTHVTTELKSGVLVARITTSAISEYEVQVITPQIREEAPGAAWHVVVDLADVAHMASSGLGMLVELSGAAKKNKGKFVVCNVSPAILEVLKLTNLNKLFPITDNTDKAIRKVS